MRGYALGFIYPLEDDSGDVDIGRVVGSDRQPVDGGVALQPQHLLGQHAAPLDGDPRPVLARKGTGDQYLGRFAGDIRGLVADEGDAVVVLPPPGNVLSPADPHPGRAAYPRLCPPHREGGRGGNTYDDTVGAAFLRCEGHHALGAGIGGQLAGIDQGVLRLPLPPPTAALVLHKRVDPFAAGDLDRQFLIRQALALPIDGHHVYRHLLAGLADVLLRGQAHVELALVHHHVAAAGDDLPIVAIDGGLDCQPLPARHHLRRQHNRETTLSIRRPGAAEDELGGRLLPPPAPAAGPRVLVVGKVVATKLGRLEAVGRGEDAPLDGGIGNRAAEEVAHLDVSARRLPGSHLRLARRDRHLELGRAVGGDLEHGGKVIFAQAGVEMIPAQRSPLSQRQFTVESAEFVQRQHLAIDLFPNGVVDADLHPPPRRQAVLHVVLHADDATEVNGLSGPVDGPVGVDVRAVTRVRGLRLQAKIPGADACAPIPGRPGHGEGLLRHDVDLARATRREASQALRIRRRGGERRAVGIHDGQLEPAGRLSCRQVGRPDPHLAPTPLERQVVLGDDQQLAVAPVIVPHPRGPEIEQVDARRERLAPGQVHQRAPGLVERSLDTQRPLADGAAGGVVLPPASLGAEELVRVEPVESQIETVGVQVADEDARRLVGVECADGRGNANLGPGIEVGGAEAHRQLLAGDVAVGVSDIGADAHLVVGGGLRAKLEHEGVVPPVEVGIDLRRRKRRRHFQVWHHRGRVDGRVEDDLKGGVGPGIPLAVVGVGAEDARQGNGGETPDIIPPHASATARALDALVHPRRVGRVEGQPSVGSEGKCRAVHLRGASNLSACGLQVKRRLCRGRIDRHVEGDPHDGIDADQLLVLRRRDPHDLRRLGGERPLIVLCQHAAGGILQPGRDAGGVGGAPGQDLVGGKDVDGGVEPLAAAGDGRVEGERLGQLGVGRVADRHQRDDGPVEDDGDGAFSLHVRRIWGRNDLRHLQVADGAKAEAVSAVDGVAVGRLGLRAEGDQVLGVPLQLALGLKVDRAVIDPLDAACDVGTDEEGRLDGALVHRPVKDQLNGAVGRELLARLRRALDDDGGDVAGRRRRIRRRGRKRRRRGFSGTQAAYQQAAKQNQHQNPVKERPFHQNTSCDHATHRVTSIAHDLPAW